MNKFVTKAAQAIRQTLFKRVEVHEDYQTVFNSVQGQRVLLHICKVGFVTKSTFVAGDPHHTAMNEGRRNLALSILSFVHKDHAALIKQVEDSITEHENQ